jgi:hypothetical protein
MDLQSFVGERRIHYLLRVAMLLLNLNNLLFVIYIYNF